MKKISTIILVAITVAACHNTGDKNESSIKVREADSAIKVNKPNDAAGSSGRNDTATTPLQLQETPKGSNAGSDSSSTKQPGKSGKHGDSTK